MVAVPTLAITTVVAGEMYRSIQAHAAHAPAPRAAGKIVISIAERKLTILRGGIPAGEYDVAVGKPETPTPTGEFRIADKQSIPGPGTGVFGVRWMEFHRVRMPEGGFFLYGIHGTNEPEKIGDAVSHGCVRLSNHDIEEVFREAYVGEPVVIVDSSAPRGPR